MIALCKALLSTPAVLRKGGRRVPIGRGVSATAHGEQVPGALGHAEGEAVAPAPVGVPLRGRAYPAEGLRVQPEQSANQVGIGASA